MELTESIRFVATKEDKQILSTIAKQDGQASMSAVIRRLIQSEAKQRGIIPASQPDPITSQSSS